MLAFFPLLSRIGANENDRKKANNKSNLPFAFILLFGFVLLNRDHSRRFVVMAINLVKIAQRTI